MGDEERDEIMEEDEAGGQEEAVGSTETSKIVKILLYVAGGILLIVLVIGVSYIVSKNVQESSYEKRQDIVAAPPPPPLSGFDLQPFAKTTADVEPHFMKMEITLAYEHSLALNNELVNRRDQIRHIVNVILQGKKYDDLDSVSDTNALIEEIKAHINSVLINGKIKEIYFRELVVN